ncbi:alcohol dehydrogenase catalytic domain-containing protein [Micromonospora sp. WMMC273]|uniref:alcohol dehydrogenase catalytic domain-containing protein n=1 Tax=Micromonospora sp. WMMC273 TaxID=3015157 RepID=UPI003FA54203
MRALLAYGVDQPLTVEEVELPDPGPGEVRVRVRVRAAGVCHSDLSMVNGTVAPPYLLVLGPEAAGEVIEVGPGVDRVRPGTRVVLNWAPPCRRRWAAPRKRGFSGGGSNLHRRSSKP